MATKARAARTRRTRRWEAELRKFALGFPEAREEFPWGHSAFKVRGKVFLFMSSEEKDDRALSLSVKLPSSRAVALMLPFAEPTGYGLGRSGWVSARFPLGTGRPSRCSVSGSRRATEPSPRSACSPSRRRVLLERRRCRAASGRARLVRAASSPW